MILRLRHRLQGWQVTSLGCGNLGVGNNLWVSSGCHEVLLCRANRWKLDHSRTWSDGEALGWEKLGLMGNIWGIWWSKLGLKKLVRKKPLRTCLLQHVSYFWLGHRIFEYEQVRSSKGSDFSMLFQVYKNPMVFHSKLWADSKSKCCLLLVFFLLDEATKEVNLTSLPLLHLGGCCRF